MENAAVDGYERALVIERVVSEVIDSASTRGVNDRPVQAGEIAITGGVIRETN